MLFPVPYWLIKTSLWIPYRKIKICLCHRATFCRLLQQVGSWLINLGFQKAGQGSMFSFSKFAPGVGLLLAKQVTSSNMIDFTTFEIYTQFFFINQPNLSPKFINSYGIVCIFLVVLTFTTLLLYNQLWENNCIQKLHTQEINLPTTLDYIFFKTQLLTPIIFKMAAICLMYKQYSFKSLCNWAESLYMDLIILRHYFY